MNGSKFNNLIPKLPESTVKGIHDVMLDACIAYELGGNYQLVLAKAKNQAAGTTKKAFEYLLSAGELGMDNLGRSLLYEF